MNDPLSERGARHRLVGAHGRRLVLLVHRFKAGAHETAHGIRHLPVLRARLDRLTVPRLRLQKDHVDGFVDPAGRQELQRLLAGVGLGLVVGPSGCRSRRHRGREGKNGQSGMDHGSVSGGRRGTAIAGLRARLCKGS
jgi:hypothetical protein